MRSSRIMKNRKDRGSLLTSIGAVSNVREPPWSVRYE
jgi:hypothetical protein